MFVGMQLGGGERLIAVLLVLPANRRESTGPAKCVVPLYLLCFCASVKVHPVCTLAIASCGGWCSLALALTPLAALCSQKC